MYYFTLAVTPMMLASGVFFPIEQLPEWLQVVSQGLPLTHAVVLARPLMTGIVPDTAWLHVLVLLAYAAASLYAALVLTRRRLLG
jgi:lipooligosaccharide transport system permease protein